MPADLVIRESDLQAFIERTVLRVQNARNRLMTARGGSGDLPVKTADFEIAFTGILIMDSGANALERESQSVSGGSKSITTTVDGAQKTTTTQQPEESAESSDSTTTSSDVTNAATTANETSESSGSTGEEQKESQTTSEQSTQNFGRETDQETEYEE